MAFLDLIFGRRKEFAFQFLVIISYYSIFVGKFKKVFSCYLGNLSFLRLKS